MPRLLPVLEAFYLGLLTAVLPCVLTQSVTALSYIAKHVARTSQTLLSASMYVAGRSLVYIGLAAVCATAALTTEEVALFLQLHINKVMGPILIAAGMFMFELIPFPGPGTGIGKSLKRGIDRGSLLASLGLGMLLALCFCPPVAGIYFFRLIPLSVEHQSPVLIPLAFGIGTALPIAVFAVLIAVASGSIARVFNKVDQAARWARRVTGAVFILAGVLYSLTYIFGVL